MSAFNKKNRILSSRITVIEKSTMMPADICIGRWRLFQWFCQVHEESGLMV